MLAKGEMPPKKERQPTVVERQAMLNWLDATLSKHDPTGGTVLRRLNREEYENTVRDILEYHSPLQRAFHPTSNTMDSTMSVKG